MSCPARWAARFGQATLELAAELRRVSAEVGLRPSQVAYVGDRLDNDVLPAKAAGMFAVFMRRGPWGHLHAHRADAACADAADGRCHL